MKLGVFSIAAAARLSAAIFLLIVVSAITSYWYTVQLVFPVEKTSNMFVEFEAGGISFTSKYCYPTNWIALHPWALSADDGPRRELTLVRRHGFQSYRVLVPQYYGMPNWWHQRKWKSFGFIYTRHTNGARWTFVIPHYFLLWLTSLLPACRLWRWRDRRRQSLIARHICLRCGYDLRASAATCPECGEVIPDLPDLAN